MTTAEFEEINARISVGWARIAGRWQDRASEQFDNEHLHALQTALVKVEAEADAGLTSLQHILDEITVLENSL